MNVTYKVSLVTIMIACFLSCKNNSKSSGANEKCKGEYKTSAKYPAGVQKDEANGVLPGETCFIRETMVASNFFMLEEKLHVKVIGYKEGHEAKPKDCQKDISVTYVEEKCFTN